MYGMGYDSVKNFFFTRVKLTKGQKLEQLAYYT